MIKFIYFDVGGVVIKDFSKTKKWEEFMSIIGVKPSDHEEFDEFWERLEVSVAEDMNFIIPLINRKFSLNLPDDYDLLSEFTKRFEKNESIWPIITKAKDKYKLGLLTDQYPGMLDDIYKRDLMPEIDFDLIIDSSVEKVKKPYPEIYKLAEERSGFRGAEILFIDNSQKNLEEANKLDWHTLLYDPTNTKNSNRKLIELIT